MMDGIRVRRAFRYTALYTLRLIAAIAAVCILALYLMNIVSSATSMPLDFNGVSNNILRYVPMMVPVVILAFLSGYQTPGTRERLAFRIILNLYLVFLTLFVSNGTEYSLEDVMLDPSTGVVVDRLTLNMDISRIGYILLVIPICSTVDACREYMSKENGIRPDDSTR